ncbi:hypothetical protein [Acetoanaerobium noterae]|uniref:hypothetical protein n=1 Tax=Acetoanaerobium noterae TaxID=745369 RepID=UPI0028A9B762|nr:hypothetical protein [Acetoanaerobium noterae]
MIKWIMITFSILLFVKVSVCIVSPKTFLRFTDLFNENVKMHLRFNKLSYILSGYITSTFVFIKGLNKSEQDVFDPYTSYVFIFVMMMVFPLNIILNKTKNIILRSFISVLFGLLLSLILFWAALLTSI